MFYYYEKDGKILASDRGDLPYSKAEPAPGAPVFYLVEGDPVLGRGSFKVTHPGQLKALHGLEVLDASRPWGADSWPGQFTLKDPRPSTGSPATGANRRPSVTGGTAGPKPDRGERETRA